MSIPAWGLLPFAALLACIALLPLLPATARRWEHNSAKLVVALGLGIPVALWVWFGGSPQLVTHSLAEYAQFIILLFSLYTVSGGLFLDGNILATPRNNTLLLAVGGLLASFIGTTGAAMLLIRPLLNTNRERAHKAHTIIFTIFIVANCGGVLTPLGDPPLYIGLLRGVPFTWTFTLWPEWLCTIVLLLVTYYGIDKRAYAAESPAAIAWDGAAHRPLRLKGGLNIVFFAVIIAAVACLGEYPLIRIGVQLGAAALSYCLGSKTVRHKDNAFTWAPIIEVAVLFAGIFLTMIPALEFLRAHAQQLPLNEYTLFGFTGALSSVLDNAPTYLTFFEMATQLTAPGQAVVAGVPALYLSAISLGAVMWGAMTYIGNGPNFMIKAVAEESGVVMPGFGAYISWAARYLLPVLIVQVTVFISRNWPVRAAGIVLALVLVVRAVWMARRPPQPVRPGRY